MEQALPIVKNLNFHRLKIAKKEKLTKNVFFLEFDIPQELQKNFRFEAGQYVVLRYLHQEEIFQNDFSMISAPFEDKIQLAIKINSEESSVNSLFENYKIGDELEVSEPKGRFTLVSKPHEFRTIVGFAAGIGITPIFSHFKNILHNEPRTRILLFYGNKSKNEVVFYQELEDLKKNHPERFEVHYFFSREKVGNALLEGRLDEKKLNLIINQIMMIDDTDEEVTLWDSVDEVLICGKGEMIKSIANGCYQNGIPKKNIHFELFETFNEDIYPVEKEFPLLENIDVEFKIFKNSYQTKFEDNKTKILQQLLIQKYPVPYSCKSGICGSCICKLEEGEVELLENEYLTENEEKGGKILACMSIPMSKKIKINFDLD